MSTTSSRRFERVQLANGIQLVVIENPALPLVTMQCLLDAGHLVEQPGEDGALHLAGRLLLSGGAGERSGEELYQVLEDAAVRHSLLASGVRFETPLAHVDLCYDVLADVLTSPRFDPARFELEHGRMEADLVAAEGNTRLVAREAFNREIYGEEHPLGRPSRGTVASCRALTRERVLELFGRHVGPDRTLLAVAGQVQAEQVVRELEQRLADWEHPTSARDPLPEPRLTDRPDPVFVERPGKEKLQVYMGHLGIRRQHPDFYALHVLDQVFGYGSGFTNRIARRVRDQLGLAYSVFATIAETAGREPGSFLLYAGTFPDKLDALQAAVREELATLLADGVTESELEDAKTFLCGSFVFETETNNHLSELGLKMLLHDLPLDYVERHPESIRTVTREDVHAAARAHLHPDALLTVACGRRGSPTND